MPKGKTASALSLRERREVAADLYMRGENPSSVARELRVTWDTAKRYQVEYEERIKQEAGKNPKMLSQVLENTIRTLEELDAIRRKAWSDYEKTQSKQIRGQLLNTILRAQAQRAQLFGLFGVKQEFFLTVNNVRIVQDRLLEFMSRHLCEKDREALEKLLTTELADYLEDRPPAITVEAMESDIAS